MRVRFEISRFSNKWFFISNFTEFHFSTDIKCNETWVAQFGVLTEIEKNALEELRPVLKRYSYTKNSFSCRRFDIQVTAYSLNEAHAWKNIGAHVTKRELQAIKNAFSVFETRFQSWWKERAHYSETVETFKKDTVGKTGAPAYDAMSSLFGSELPNELNVIVLYTPFKEESGAGTAVARDRVTLRVPQLKKNTWQYDFTRGVLLHELGHILFDGARLRTKVARSLKDNKIREAEASQILMEAIIESFAPRGYVAQKYFPLVAPLMLSSSQSVARVRAGSSHSRRDMIQAIVWQLYPFAVHYGREKKVIDNNFIAEAAHIYIGIKSAR